MSSSVFISVNTHTCCFLRLTSYVTSLCDFRLQEVQGTKYRAQLLPQNEMYSNKQGPHRQCQVSHMEGKQGGAMKAKMKLLTMLVFVTLLHTTTKKQLC